MTSWRRVLTLILVMLAAAPVWAQKPSILLSNAENLELYYLVDPPGLTGPDTTSAVFVGRVVSFFSETTPAVTFQHLAPLGLERIEGLGGTVSVTGEPGRGTTVIARIPLPAEGGLA